MLLYVDLQVELVTVMSANSSWNGCSTSIHMDLPEGQYSSVASVFLVLQGPFLLVSVTGAMQPVLPLPWGLSALTSLTAAACPPAVCLIP